MTTSNKKTTSPEPANASRRVGRPVLAVTTGEPGGIGPEITARFFAGFRPGRSTALVIGSMKVLGPVFTRYGTEVSVINPGARGAPGGRAAARPSIDDLAAVTSDVLAERGSRRFPDVLVLDTACSDRFSTGRDSRGGGRHSGVALETACRLASDGVAEGIVTAPLSKNSLNMAGYKFTGHTEMLAKYFRAPDCQMVMTYRHFRVVPLTRHVPLKSVSRQVTKEKIVTAIRVLEAALREQFGVARPTIAVAGLNPHAGDGGVIGREEIEVIKPALERARRMGFRVEGPVAGDALFQHAASGTFDAFISMYHDQGLIPFKMISKRRGVNVTVGLPVIRTSVDHGVAYDLVDQGVASIDSLAEAYRLAEKLASSRRKAPL